jgi:hypothetical protein
LAGLSNAEIVALLPLSARTRDHIGSTVLPCLGGDLLSARYGQEQWRLEDDRVRDRLGMAGRQFAGDGPAAVPRRPARARVPQEMRAFLGAMVTDAVAEQALGSMTSTSGTASWTTARSGGLGVAPEARVRPATTADRTDIALPRHQAVP